MTNYDARSGSGSGVSDGEDGVAASVLQKERNLVAAGLGTQSMTERNKASATIAASYTCAAPGCVKTGLFQCSNCKLVRYCSVDCQRGDWKRHKSTCKAKK